MTPPEADLRPQLPPAHYRLGPLDCSSTSSISPPSLPRRLRSSLSHIAPLPFALDGKPPRQRSLPLPVLLHGRRDTDSISSASSALSVSPQRARATTVQVLPFPALSNPSPILWADGYSASSPTAAQLPQPRSRRASSSSSERCCAFCGTTKSPEWRRKDGTTEKCLCNACGLRYARCKARARKRLALQHVDSPTAQRTRASTDNVD